jgi:hypothetical protein
MRIFKILTQTANYSEHNSAFKKTVVCYPFGDCSAATYHSITSLIALLETIGEIYLVFGRFRRGLLQFGFIGKIGAMAV